MPKVHHSVFTSPPFGEGGTTGKTSALCELLPGREHGKPGFSNSTRRSSGTEPASSSGCCAGLGRSSISKPMLHTAGWSLGARRSRPLLNSVLSRVSTMVNQSPCRCSPWNTLSALDHKCLNWPSTTSSKIGTWCSQSRPNHRDPRPPRQNAFQVVQKAARRADPADESVGPS